ncbi:MAG: hypothetical protein WDN07_05090 [Actinomycetota bacterium]
MSLKAALGALVGLLCAGLFLSVAGATSASAGELAMARNIVVAQPLTTLSPSS